MIAVLDYGAGNLASVCLALEAVGAPHRVVADVDAAAGAERLVFPGVGSAASGMDLLRRRGFDRLLLDAARRDVPILGVCLGMQLLHEHSEEDGGVDGLGLLPGRVRRFDFEPGRRVKVPHMGWNDIEVARPHPWLPASAAFYFVHSYYAELRDDATVGVTEYGGRRFASAAARGSVFGIQAHPERSAAAGLEVWRRFATAP